MIMIRRARVYATDAESGVVVDGDSHAREDEEGDTSDGSFDARKVTVVLDRPSLLAASESTQSGGAPKTTR